MAALAVAGTCVALAGYLAIGAYTRHRRVQHAMRVGSPLPGSVLVPLLGVGIGATAVLCALLIVLG